LKFIKYFIPIFLLILACGCIEERAPEVLEEKLDITASAIPNSIIGGETTMLYFDFENNGDVDIHNIYLKIVDPCILNASRIMTYGREWNMKEPATVKEGGSFTRTCNEFVGGTWVESDYTTELDAIEADKTIVGVDVDGKHYTISFPPNTEKIGDLNLELKNKVTDNIELRICCTEPNVECETKTLEKKESFTWKDCNGKDYIITFKEFGYLVEATIKRKGGGKGSVSAGKGEEIKYGSFKAVVRNIRADEADLQPYCKTTKVDISEYGIGLGDLKQGQIKSWEQEFKSEKVSLPIDCNIRYTTSYEANMSGMYDITAISQDEYARLVREGKEQQFSPQLYKTKSPIDIEISFSKKQPIIENKEFYFYIKFRNVGEGTVENFDVSIDYPDFLTKIDCSDLSGKPLTGSLEFRKKETKKVVCKFNATDIDIIEKGQFIINARYGYKLDKTIYLKVLNE